MKQSGSWKPSFVQSDHPVVNSGTRVSVIETDN